MTYPWLAAIFLGAAALVAVLVVVLAPARAHPAGQSPSRPRPWPHPGAVALTVVALVVLTAVFDSVMIAAGLFDYDPASLAGPRIGLVPIEDFAYPLATAVLLPAVWEVLRRRRRAPADAATSGEDVSR